MLLVRPRSDIFFANVQHFRRDLYAALEARDPKPSIVLIDASRRYLFEFTGHEAVREMVADLRDQGFEIWGVLPRGEAADAIRVSARSLDRVRRSCFQPFLMQLRHILTSLMVRRSRNHPLGVRRLAVVSSMLWVDRLIGFADDSRIEGTNSLWRH